MKRFASTRSENRASHPWAGRAQCRVGSIDEDGIRYGLTTHALTASTIAIAPTIVTTQSTTTRTLGGSFPVTRSSGWWRWGRSEPAAGDGGGVGQEKGGAGGGGWVRGSSGASAAGSRSCPSRHQSSVDVPSVGGSGSSHDELGR